MDTWGLNDEQTEGRVFYSLIGVGGRDLETVRKVARKWLDEGITNAGKPELAAKLPRTIEGKN